MTCENQEDKEEETQRKSRRNEQGNNYEDTT